MLPDPGMEISADGLWMLARACWLARVTGVSLLRCWAQAQREIAGGAGGHSAIDRYHVASGLEPRQLLN